MLYLHSLHYCSLCNTCPDRLQIFGRIWQDSHWGFYHRPDTDSGVMVAQTVRICAIWSRSRIDLFTFSCRSELPRIWWGHNRSAGQNSAGGEKSSNMLIPHTPPKFKSFQSIHKIGPGDSGAISSFLMSCKWSFVCLLSSSQQRPVLPNSALIQKLAKRWNVGWSKERRMVPGEDTQA